MLRGFFANIGYRLGERKGLCDSKRERGDLATAPFPRLGFGLRCVFGTGDLPRADCTWHNVLCSSMVAIPQEVNHAAPLSP